MKNSKYARFFAILKQINANGEALTKEEAVNRYTGGSTGSLSSLSPVELAGLERSLAALVKNRSNGPQQPIDQVADRLRKGIISQFLSIGRTAADAKAWAEKYGVRGNKRKFNDYDHQELYMLFQNAKKVKLDYIKSFNR